MEPEMFVTDEVGTGAVTVERAMADVAASASVIQRDMVFLLSEELGGGVVLGNRHLTLLTTP
jgi:adenosyl cobinamide kinase/adenosyl cobinamide phosphate guanylyltransferase